MPVVSCPGCAREIHLALSELTLLIQCARCNAEFYPISAPGTPQPALPPPPQPVVEAPSAAEPESPQPPRPKPRRKKPRRKTSEYPLVLVLGVSFGLLMFLGASVTAVMLIVNGAFEATPTKTPGPEKESAASIPPPLAPPGGPVAPAPPPAPPPGPAAAPAPMPMPPVHVNQPPTTGNPVDLGGTLQPKTPPPK